MTSPDTLALHGGEPVRKRRLPYGRHVIEEADVAAVTDALRSDWITTGPRVALFEEAFADAVGARHAVSFSSGTAALHAAAAAAGLGPGDEAITTPLTFCATANCVVYQGASPVFADVQPDTLLIDPEQIEARITRRTRAILPVDFGGQPAELDVIHEIAEQRGLVVIEDACHAPGALLDGRPVGSLATMTAFSFHPVKHLAAGEGGMITTDDAELAQRLMRFRNHGIDTDLHAREARGDWHYEMIELGYNYRLSDLACALAHSQLERLQDNLHVRSVIAARYRERLQGFPGLTLPRIRPETTPAWHLFPILLEPRQLRADRAEIFRALHAEGIGVNVHYLPVHLHSYYRKRGHAKGECPVAEAAYERLLTLPLFHGMFEEDADDVIRAVAKVLAYYAGD